MDFRKNVLANFKEYKKNCEMQLQKEEDERQEKLQIAEENKLMLREDNNQKRILFYKKMNVTKESMYMEYLFDCHYDTPNQELRDMYNEYLRK